LLIAGATPILKMLAYLEVKKDPNTRETIAESLMRMLIAGPEVSLRGSPTVSPTTAAT